MDVLLPDAMREVTRLTRSGNLTAATAAIQKILRGQSGSPERTHQPPRAPFSGITIAGFAEQAEEQSAAAELRAESRVGAWTARQFSNKAGNRPYRLYVPAGYCGKPVPLVVMLHGCTQSPEDFAAGTRMNAIAERETVIVAYPAQIASANMQGCWNWFNPADQARGSGEPSIIAGITAKIMRDHGVDPRRVYVAGMSAGGAAAAIMGHRYSELYAAIGIHSGLACGAASDMPSALAAMKRGPDKSKAATPQSGERPVPTIIFHGDQDMTVNRKNADAVAAQATHGASLAVETINTATPGGYSYRRTIGRDPSGITMFEQWTVHGGGHAWFGGSPAGTYTDGRGPDASNEMMRFFLAHPMAHQR